MAPMKTMARAEEMLRGEKNTFRELSSSPNIFNKLMANLPFASWRSSIREGLVFKNSRYLQVGRGRRQGEEARGSLRLEKEDWRAARAAASSRGPRNSQAKEREQELKRIWEVGSPSN